MNIQKILESKEVIPLYKRLLQVLGEYSVDVPCTGVDKLFNMAVEHGAKILPKDKVAIAILHRILWDIDGKMHGPTSPMVVHKLLNTRFADLPIEVRPMIKVGRRHEVAFWSRSGEILDRVRDLIDFGATGKSGNWANVDGEKAEIIDIQTAVATPA